MLVVYIIFMEGLVEKGNINSADLALEYNFL